MKRVTIAKIVSAGAIANLAAIGQAGPPAQAEELSAAATPSGYGVHPELLLMPADKVNTLKLSAQLRQAIAQAARAASKPAMRARGFVPKAGSGNPVPLTWSSCNNHVCETVFGNGLYVSYVTQWFVNFGGCHHAHLYWGNQSDTSPTCYYSNQIAERNFYYSLSKSEYICGDFYGGVPGIACVRVHR